MQIHFVVMHNTNRLRKRPPLSLWAFHRTHFSIPVEILCKNPFLLCRSSSCSQMRNPFLIRTGLDFSWFWLIPMYFRLSMLQLNFGVFERNLHRAMIPTLHLQIFRLSNLSVCLTRWKTYCKIFHSAQSLDNFNIINVKSCYLRFNQVTYTKNNEH